MTPWPRGVYICAHPENYKITLQQFKSFCTYGFALQEQRFRRPQILQSSHDQLTCCCTRLYSWRGRPEADALPLYRSRTAYYDILKVTPHATQTQIKTAYYQQSFVFHPDKNPDNVEATRAFSEINEAYTVLGNITLRRKYDRGILSESDVRGAGKPSKSSTTSSSKPSEFTQQQRSKQFTQRGGKVFYDFDAFYKAHYGEQLQREQEMKARKQRMQEMREKDMKTRQHRMILEILTTVLGVSAILILYNISSS